jgi:hypothetical protein
LPPLEPEPLGKTRITIRLDEDLVDFFLNLKESGASGGAMGHQTLRLCAHINASRLQSAVIPFEHG